MEIDLAKAMTKKELDSHVSNNPSSNEFYYRLKYESKNYLIHWTRDIHFDNSGKWHASVAETKDI
jgi:hypothetical protein